MYDLNYLRDNEFPLSHHTIYMNHAGVSPLPSRTREKTAWVLRQLAENPTRFWMTTGKEITESFKSSLAALINAQSPQEIIPVTTTSIGLNMIAQAVPWQAGDNILLCDIEFPSNVYPWLSLSRDGVEVRRVPAQNGGLTVSALAQVVDERTRMVTASAIQFFSGHRTDLTAVGQFCQERGILFVVDAIQAVGHMKIDVQASHIDVLASGGQKSLLATPGQGFMYVRQAVAEQMQPRIVAGNGTANFLHWLDYDLTYAPSAERFGSGTTNLAGITAVVESLTLLKELGIEQIDTHTRQLADQMHNQLTQIGFTVVTPQPAPGPIITFKMPLSAEAAEAAVTQFHERNVIVVRHLDAAGDPYLRASLHCYNSSREVEQFAAVAKEILC